VVYVRLFAPSQLLPEQAAGTIDNVKGRGALFAEVSGFLGDTHKRFRARRCRTDEIRGWSRMQSRWILR
jgi:hypothetical protein